MRRTHKNIRQTTVEKSFAKKARKKTNYSINSLMYVRQRRQARVSINGEGDESLILG